MKRAVAVLCAAVIVSLAASVSTQPAQAYTTSSNWYSKTWWFNKSETYRIAWVEPNPAVALNGIIGMPWQLRAALSAYGYSFKWAARYARSHNGCLSIYWIYVNLPVPSWYRGWACY